MSYPLKITDTLRNWNIAKSYLKNGPNIRNSWFEFAVPKNMLQMELVYKNGGCL